jgi:hypothetical protein
MFRFVVAGVVAMTLAIFSTVLGLLPPDEAKPPHVQLPDRGSTIATGQPGSNLEGIRTALIPAAVVGMQIAAAQAQAAAEAAEIAEEAAQEQASQPAPASSADSESDGAWTWDDTARCETGGDWSMQGSSYSGGLGFANSTWDAYGGQEFAPNAGMASREQQIQVAERIQSTPGGCNGW